MADLILALLASVRSALRCRGDLVLENLALRVLSRNSAVG